MFSDTSLLVHRLCWCLLWTVKLVAGDPERRTRLLWHWVSFPGDPAWEKYRGGCVQAQTSYTYPTPPCLQYSKFPLYRKRFKIRMYWVRIAFFKLNLTGCNMAAFVEQRIAQRFLQMHADLRKQREWSVFFGRWAWWMCDCHGLPMIKFLTMDMYCFLWYWCW